MEKGINELLLLNVNDIDKLNTAVVRTKWFKQFTPEQLTPTILETGYNKIAAKYNCEVALMYRSTRQKYVLVIVDKGMGNWIAEIFCDKLQEGLCKVILALYAYYVKGIKLRS